MSESTNAAPTRPLLEVLLIFLVFFVAAGDPPPHVNETHYLTKAKHYWNPDYCPGDYFLDSADAHLVFYWSVGWLTQLAPLPVVAWLGRIAAWLWLAWCWQRLAQTVGTPRYTSVVAAMLLVAATERANFAGEWVVGGVEAKCFAYGLVFLGLAALAVQRYLSMGLCFGAAAAWHVLVGGWAVVAAGIVWLANPASWRATWRPAAAGLVLGGIVSLPGLLPALALTSQATPEASNQAAQVYVFERLRHHLAPLALPPAELAERLFRFALLAAAFLALWLFHQREAQSAQQPATTREPDNEPLLRVLQFAGASIIFSAVGLVLEVLLLDHPAMAARWLRYYWFRLADVAVATAAALAVCVALKHLTRGRATALLAVALAAGGGHLATVAVERGIHPAPPAVRRMHDAPAWIDACRWVRENGPPDAVFLIPWGAQSFKWYAYRADVGNRKDIPQDAAGVLEWARRQEDHYASGNPRTAGRRQSLRKKSEGQLLDLARRYDATHVLVENHELRLPLLYENDEYAIYRLEELPRD